MFAQEATQVAEESKFLAIISDNKPIGPLIWCMIFLLSAVSLSTILYCFLNIRQGILLPTMFIKDVSQAMGEGDLDKAVALCQKNNSPISSILKAGFSNVDLGFQAIETAVESKTQVEVEKVTQKVSLLNLFGQIAPMLGLLGTVTGMVTAFDALATTEGAEKAKTLGLAISQALWTTCAGLLIAIPAIFSYTLLKNKAIKLLLNGETIVEDLLKDLRFAEFEENDEA